MDDELYQNGSVIWAKFAGRPWWPCVVFKTWDDVRDWGVPIAQTTCDLGMHEVSLQFVLSLAGIPESVARADCFTPFSRAQVLGVLLEEYSAQIIDKRDCCVQDWDYISPETVLVEFRSMARSVRKRLKRAIADARLLVSVAQQNGDIVQESMLPQDMCCWADDSSALLSTSNVPQVSTKRSRSTSVADISSSSDADDLIVVSERDDDDDDEENGLHSSTRNSTLVSLSPSPSHRSQKKRKIDEFLSKRTLRSVVDAKHPHAAIVSPSVRILLISIPTARLSRAGRRTAGQVLLRRQTGSRCCR